MSFGPQEGYRENPLGTMFKHRKKKKVIQNIKLAFANGKLDLSNLMTFCEDVLVLLTRGQQWLFSHLVYTKTF